MFTEPVPRVTIIGLNEMFGTDVGGVISKGWPPPKPPEGCTDSWVIVPVRVTFPENPSRPESVRVELVEEFTVALRDTVLGVREKSLTVRVKKVA
jgi:hypothetical protein